MSKEAFARIAQKITDLRRELQDLDFQYHALGQSPIPDHEFDAKLRELEVLEKDYPQFSDPNSPTARLGAKPVDGFPEVKHVKRMLSLAKVFTPAELRAWLVKNQAVVYAEPKVDGLAVKLHYELGQLRLAVTRGDGTTGADVTANARAIASIPLQLRVPFTGEVVGEVYMSKASFETNNAKLIAEDEEPMANPRNAAVGTFKSKDPKVVADRRLDFIAYGPHSRDKLLQLGFRIPDVLGFMSPDMPEELLVTLLGVFQTQVKAQTFLTDGAVLKIQDATRREELGEGNTSPNWAIAYKFPPERVRTKLLDIVLSAGRTGRITPNAVLETVVVSGTKVSAATIHNEDQVKRLGINIGDDVWIEKAGEIIPAVVGLATELDLRGLDLDDDHAADVIAVMKEERAWRMPTHYIDSEGGQNAIVRVEGEVAHKLAFPKTCVDCVHAQLKHITSKSCLDWDGLGSEHCRTLVLNGVKDLYDLATIAPENTGLEGKVLERFLASREKAKTAPLWRVLHALAPEGIGTTYCKQLAALTRNWRALVATPAWRCEELMGEVKGRALHTAFPQLTEEFSKLETLGFTLDDDKLAGTGAAQTLKGMVFCVTGTLSKGRDEIHALIEAHGGLAKSSCSKSTSYLVCGDDPGATKLKAAEKHGVPVIDEQKLYALIQS
jgi:DNA ligase (NAD+)